MSKYIDKSAVIAKIDEFVKQNAAYGFSVDIFGIMMKKMVEKLPAADVAPVVRCKDCERWGTRKADGYGFCCIWGASVKGDAFCSSGVKSAKIDGGGENV